MKSIYDEDNPKPHIYNGYVREKNGHSWRLIHCPFCHTSVKASLWSMAGVGKLCSGCGAIHYTSGMSYARKSQETKEKENG